ncbi:HAD-IIB family hydrolase [Marinobacter manganoxydans]|uniref:Mannosyl-3-phosphoglycerate phosphatase family protein n=1 Tax=Marinobacter manganoxydans MnI7-9 TaxID=1094979 RepID=G6YPA3_9GAMM|nr:HAD-IIB family hydrolase [Marinobacter manganoxydans]EHJ05878.1 mannosyl-3-phosphoglycerate phosphatase family protein [Marinobacter manganoxydans MnI7-9]
MARPHLIIFSDLDGTLLDHDDYRWQAAGPALDRLKAAQIPLVLNSSKTMPEIRALREELGNNDPFIVENGAAVVIPPHALGNAEEEVVNFGATRDRVLEVLGAQRKRGARFTSFADMSANELAAETGLDPAAAGRAKERLGTEPLLWQGSEEALAEFEAALGSEGLRLVAGGRFLHAMGIFDKADGARFLLNKYREQYREQYGDAPVLAIALGDSPNDQQMLESADIPVVIRGVKSDEVRLPSAKHAMRSLKPGPEGWNECVLNLLFEYGY